MMEYFRDFSRTKNMITEDVFLTAKLAAEGVFISVLVKILLDFENTILWFTQFTIILGSIWFLNRFAVIPLIQIKFDQQVKSSKIQAEHQKEVDERNDKLEQIKFERSMEKLEFEEKIYQSRILLDQMKKITYAQVEDLMTHSHSIRLRNLSVALTDISEKELSSLKEDVKYMKIYNTVEELRENINVIRINTLKNGDGLISDVKSWINDNLTEEPPIPPAEEILETLTSTLTELNDTIEKTSEKEEEEEKLAEE